MVNQAYEEKGAPRNEEELKRMARAFREEFGNQFVNFLAPAEAAYIAMKFGTEMNLEFVVAASAYEKYIDEVTKDVDEDLEKESERNARRSRLEALVAFFQCGLPQMLALAPNDEDFIDLACKYAGEIHAELNAMKYFWV
ncbi:MAG: hypothetical protein JWN37_407 [Candidatus Nomurabacteria bacterium]|nr:hypothetical protein [Candidatus Nomurabacteria bacterium]